MSFWIDSVRSVVGICCCWPVALAPKGMVEGGRSAMQRLKAGEGKMVSDLVRMLVTVSGWRR